MLVKPSPLPGSGPAAWESVALAKLKYEGLLQGTQVSYGSTPFKGQDTYLPMTAASLDEAVMAAKKLSLGTVGKRLPNGEVSKNFGVVGVLQAKDGAYFATYLGNAENVAFGVSYKSSLADVTGLNPDLKAVVVPDRYFNLVPAPAPKPVPPKA
jgi:hypothetical protein